MKEYFLILKQFINKYTLKSKTPKIVLPKRKNKRKQIQTKIGLSLSSSLT